MSEQPVYDVVWPLGRRAMEVQSLPLRRAAVTRSSVALLWNRLYQVDLAVLGVGHCGFVSELVVEYPAQR